MLLAARNTPIGALIGQLEHVRNEQTQLSRGLADETRGEPRDALWGRAPLLWVVTKTLQHTAEHTHDMLAAARPMAQWVARTIARPTWAGSAEGVQ